MPSARFTVNEVADKLAVDKELARGLVRLLVGMRLAELRGERRPESGRGRAEAVYVFTDGYEKALAAKLKRAELS